jgi:hypothetical protein
MSISHWGFFPGYWIAVMNNGPDAALWTVRAGAGRAAWLPCSFEEAAEW